MDPRYTDANQVLHFSRTRLGWQYFVIGAIGLGFGALLIAAGGRKDFVGAGYVLVLIGFLLCMYAMHRHFHPGKPLLSLGLDGVRFKLDLMKELHVPWHEVKALRKIDVSDVTARGPFAGSFHGVTALVISNAYYDRHLDPGNLLLRGPGWGNLFIPGDDGRMQFALYGGLVSLSEHELFTAVETRWKAFRERSA